MNQMSKLQSLPSSLSSLQFRILRYSLVEKMATSLQWKNKGVKSATPTGRFAEHFGLTIHQFCDFGFPYCTVGTIIVLPLRVFVGTAVKQQKYNTVPRTSFLQEIIPVLISYRTVHLPYSTAGFMKANTAVCLSILKILDVDQMPNLLYL